MLSSNLKFTKPIRRGSVAQNRFLGQLPPDEVCALTALGRTIAISKGQLLMQAGEPAEHVYFPVEGLIGLVASLPEGKSIQVCSIGAEGALGLGAALGFERAVAQAVVLIPGTALRVPAPLFAARAKQSADIRKLASLYMYSFITELVEMVACTAFHDVETRLCRYLLDVRDRIGSNTLPLTHEMLAEALGVKRTTITFVAGTLQSKGIISYHRGTLEIRNDVALTTLALSHCRSAPCVPALLNDAAPPT